MEAWAIASFFIATILWMESEAKFEYFLNQIVTPRRRQFFTHPKEESLQSNFKRSTANNHFDLFDKEFEESFDEFKKFRHQSPAQEAQDRRGEAEHVGYDDYKTSQSTHILGPHQIETIQSEHFHKKVPAYDVSDFQHHQPKEKHAEVHYHQHKHVHKHDHKQEHVHQHKNEHQHKHLHKQEHKHSHHSEHKHGHNHKHDHQQEHKHDHSHDHKHDHHQNHKHEHQHGHKHNHQSHNKHQHKHGHKHKHSKY